MSRAKPARSRRIDQEPGARERILEAAIELVSEGGPAAATARDICDAAGVSAPTLYYYFDDLYQLYDEVLQLMYVPESQAHPGRELIDPRGLLDYSWDCCLNTARSRPGLVDLKNHLVSIGKVPPSLTRFYARVEHAFEQLGRDGQLNFPPREAASIFWSAAVGAALRLAAARRRRATFATGADESLRRIVLAAVLKDMPDRRRRRAPVRPPA